MNTTIQKPLRKANFCYEQSKNKSEGVPNWKGKRTNNFEQWRKGFKSNRNFRNNSQNYSKNTYQGTYFKSNTHQNFTTSKNIGIPNNYVKNNEQREPVKFWECEGPHYMKDYPNRKGNFSNVHIIQEEETVGDVAKEISIINAGLENWQVDHRTPMVEIEGMIKSKPLSILIDKGSSLSCVT